MRHAPTVFDLAHDFNSAAIGEAEVHKRELKSRVGIDEANGARDVSRPCNLHTLHPEKTAKHVGFILMVLDHDGFHPDGMRVS